MVKGVTKQAILVRTPDPELFDEAIFILREEAFRREGEGSEEILRQARQAADDYLRQNRAWQKKMHGLSGPWWGAAGAAAASAVWAAVLLVL